MPTSLAIPAGIDTGSRPRGTTSGPGPERRPLITARDVSFLVNYYPLRWLIRMFGTRLLDWMLKYAGQASRFLPTPTLRSAELKIVQMLKVPRDRARRIARQFMMNRLRAALFDFQPDSDGSAFRPVSLRGREHLDLALAQGRGVILVSLHALAKREARVGLERQGIELCPVIRGDERACAGNGRILWRFVRARLLPIQFQKLNRYIVRSDENASLKIVRVLRDGGIVMMSPDIPRSASSQLVRFLNMDFEFSTGALELARLTGCPLVPMWVWCSGDVCTVEFREELPLCSGAGEDARTQNLAVLVQAMEELMHAHPDQWEFWNRRHKTASNAKRLSRPPVACS